MLRPGFVGMRGQWSYDYGMQDYEYTPHSHRVGVGWQRRFKTRHPLRKLGNRLPIFCALAFFAVTMMVVELDHIVRGERTSIPRKGDDHAT